MASDNAGCAEPVSTETKLGYIYFIEAGPYYKIGKTVNPEHRPEQIISSITGNEPKLPFEPRLVGILGTFETELSGAESWVHKLFHEYRLLGEWFELSSADIRAVFSATEQPEWETIQARMSLWIDKIIWDGYAEHMELSVVVPCPS